MNRIPALALVLACAAPSAAFAGGGTIVKLEGSAVIERRGTKVQVAEATPLYSGDILNVADHGVAQVHFEDDSVFVVPGAAKLRVDAFTMPTAQAGGKAVYTLVDGGLRTITGKVSKGGKDQYELRAEEGTVTVKGSAYMVLRCQGSCAKKYKAGLYVKGEQGVMTVTNAAGQLKVKRGQTGYFASKTTLGTHVKISPFNDPGITAEYGIQAEFETEVHPPRIEQDPPASPS